MTPINPYNNIQTPSYNVVEKRTNVLEVQKPKELSRDDIISSKELSMDDKLRMLGIEKMSTEELANNLANNLLGI